MPRRREPSFPLSGWECFIALSSCLSTALWAYLPLKRHCLLGSLGRKLTSLVLEFLPPHPRKVADKLLLQHFVRWGDKILPSSPFYCQITVVEISYTEPKMRSLLTFSLVFLLLKYYSWDLTPLGMRAMKCIVIWGQPHQNSHPSSILDIGYCANYFLIWNMKILINDNLYQSGHVLLAAVTNSSKNLRSFKFFKVSILAHARCG